MDPAAVAAQFAPLFSAFPDLHWEIRNLVVDGGYKFARICGIEPEILSEGEVPKRVFALS